MIWTETEVKVIVSDEMINKIEEVLDGLDQLQNIIYKYGFNFISPNGTWFDEDNLSQAIELLAALADPKTEFTQ